eukprot:TRINITY_DN24912_c0_g1_i1.p1 TRINITY_DN24912_c0_g1~~TRINITY_DN24912_c0_g1_i1.p1  ORF type:complete len:210 (-),score=49.71 TRINITY_DN24912_c0_g1_i1:41-631(-)
MVENGGKGKSRGRGRGGRQRGKPQSETSASEELASLRERLQKAEDAESRIREEELKLREEVASAAAARDLARRREVAARDDAEEARRKAVLQRDCMKDELSGLMNQLANCERLAKEQQHIQNSWQAELDALVLSQGEAMERRDHLAADNARLEAETRRHVARTAEIEAQASRLEEKIVKDRCRIDLLKKEVAARCA